MKQVIRRGLKEIFNQYSERQRMRLLLLNLHTICAAHNRSLY